MLSIGQSQKGLHQFITDVRNSKDAAEEQRRIDAELHNIQAKFQSNLSAYHRKKYVCKLIYIHLLGVDTGIGEQQALELVQLPVFAEKQMGYIAYSVLSTDLSRLGPHLAADLRSLDDVVCVALQYVANNVTQPHDSLLDNLESVYQHCVGGTGAVKKKALLALAAIAKVHDVPAEWVPRLLAVADDPDLGVLLAALPLTRRLVETHAAYARLTVPVLALKIHQLVCERRCGAEYLYYGVPAPWAVVQLVQLAEHVFALGVAALQLDAATLGKLRLAVSAAIVELLRAHDSAQSRNAQLAVLFQAVLLLVFLDVSAEGVAGAIEALLSLLGSAETNTRYLVLDALARLLARLGCTAPFASHLDAVFAALGDRDVLVRRKAVDLLYTVCDAATHTAVVAKLLEHLPTADSALRADVLVKVAVLAERFATDPLWYVLTMLRLLAQGGRARTGGGEVWERLVQIIVNNALLQRMAAKLVFNLLAASAPENLVRVGSVVLSDFGGLIEHETQFAPEAQCRLLLDTYMRTALGVRPLVMTALAKLVQRHRTADFVPDIFDLFEAECRLLDVEVQTRAHEYLRLGSLLAAGGSGAAYADKVLAPLPPFEQTKNSLLAHIGSVGALAVTLAQIPQPQRVQLLPHWREGYRRMLQYDAGIFYESPLVKMTYRTTRQGATARVQLTVISIQAPLTAFSVLDFSSGDCYTAQVLLLPDTTIATRSAMELEIRVREVGTAPGPVLLVSFKCGGAFSTLNLRLPAHLLRTLTATALLRADFERRWAQIGVLGADGEATATVSTGHKYTPLNMQRLFQRLGFAVVEGDDVAGAGILHTLLEKYGLLVSVRGDESGRSFQCVARCTGGGVAANVIETLKEVLE